MQERRKSARSRTYFGGVVAFNRRRSTLDCLVRNFSPEGAKLTFSNMAVLPDMFDLMIERKEHSFRARVPVLIFRDLTPAEIKAFQERDETDEESELGIPIAPVDEADLDSTGTGSDESDDIIMEGEEEELPKPCTAATIALGGRLERGHLP